MLTRSLKLGDCLLCLLDRFYNRLFENLTKIQFFIRNLVEHALLLNLNTLS